MNQDSRPAPPGVSQTELERLVRALRDDADAESPATFPRDRVAAAQPGLYSWWCDAPGREILSARLGHPLPALIYAGLAGATKWPSGREGTATLYSRIRQMHLASKIDFSTFRWTLASLLMDHLRLELIGARRLSLPSEVRLTQWMVEHLRVRSVPYADRSTLGAAEDAVLATLDPPLNLSGMHSSPIRKQLSVLRAELARPPRAATATLVIVPCGKQKVWRDDPSHGPARACEAYTSDYFRKNRAYAQVFGDLWVILSAKYGFMDPEFEIPGDYNVTFNDPTTCPIAVAELKEQVRTRGLDGFGHIIGLGGATYRLMIAQSFSDTRPVLEFPFARLPIGQAVRATDTAVRGAKGHTNDAQRPRYGAPRAGTGASGPGGRYAPLRRWLDDQPERVVRTEFATIERVLRTDCPTLRAAIAHGGATTAATPRP